MFVLPKSRHLLPVLAVLLPMGAAAKEPPPEKFSIQGEVLIYDTETGIDDAVAEITNDDIESLQDVLRRFPGITELRLNSSGGSVFAGESMAWIIIDYNLNTTVSGECVSACVDLFLAGNRRRMMLGSKIGFHQRHWSAGAVESYYKSWREDEGWDTPFEFGSWIYEDTQTEIYEHLDYMVSRGVDAGFAIETLRVKPGDEWYPSRITLTAAGVLREQVPEN